MLLLATSASIASAATVNGVNYGKREIISGTWFTNFENSRFLDCNGRKCDSQLLSNWASIACQNGACETLDRQAKSITHQTNAGAPEGAFQIRFVGRRGLVRHKSRFLGDGERDVLIERVLDVRLASK